METFPQREEGKTKIFFTVVCCTPPAGNPVDLDPFTIPADVHGAKRPSRGSLGWRPCVELFHQARLSGACRLCSSIREDQGSHGARLSRHRRGHLLWSKGDGGDRVWEEVLENLGTREGFRIAVLVHD